MSGTRPVFFLVVIIAIAIRRELCCGSAYDSAAGGWRRSNDYLSMSSRSEQLNLGSA